MDSNSKVNVAIMRSQNDLLAELIEAEVRHCRHFVLGAAEQVAPEDFERLESIVQGSDLLIAIGDFDARFMEELVARHPDTIISCIMIGSDAVNVTMKRSGIQHFLETLHTLARERVHECRRYVGFRVVENNSGDCYLLEVLPERNAITNAAHEWVRHALLSYWRQLPKAEFDVLGRARSSDVVEELLSQSRLPTAAEEEARAFADFWHVLQHRVGEAPPALSRLHFGLDLDELELRFFLLALAPELDVSFQVAYGILNDDLGRRRPTYGLACAVLGKPIEVRSSIEQTGNLFRWRLIEGGHALHGDDLLRVPPSICSWILGNSGALLSDPTLASIVCGKPYLGADLLSAVEGTSVARDAGRLGHATVDPPRPLESTLRTGGGNDRITSLAIAASYYARFDTGTAAGSGDGACADRTSDERCAPDRLP